MQAEPQKKPAPAGQLSNTTRRMKFHDPNVDVITADAGGGSVVQDWLQDFNTGASNAVYLTASNIINS